MAKTQADDKPESAGKITLTKFQAGVFLAVVIVVIVVVGLMAGLLRTPSVASCSKPASSEKLLIATVQDVSPSRSKEKEGEKANSGEKLPEVYIDDGEVWRNHRLPNNIIPEHYDLVLFPDFYDGRAMFYGNVTIWLNISGIAANYLLVHVKDLRIIRSVVRLVSSLDSQQEQGQELVVQRNFTYLENEYWVIELERALIPGSLVKVQIQFDGSLENGINGLYRSRYVDSRTGEERFLATSKFQPTDARKAFPCLDEPRFKSTFNVTLVHRRNYTALSNMPQQSVVKNYAEGGLVATQFKKSVPMVTYLACFIVCDFSYKEDTATGGVPIRIFATPDKIDQADYAVNITRRILQFYEKTFGLSYPLPKLDQIAIPDFASGAMEHWGLVTYRETVLLYDEREASVFNKQRVAIVIAHELAHMWFGNLVTMNWWNDLWLNEGFASFVEYMGVNHIHPEWNMDAQFLTDDLHGVMSEDATLSSHPIVVPVDHPNNINEVFDSISYSKGAAVLRMLESFMGKDKFQKGLQLYMKKYQYKVTVTQDLWDCLSQVEGAPNVSSVMDTWTMQMGYPVVTVRFEGNEVHLKQDRFLTDRSADKTQPPSVFNYIWQIPLLVANSSGGNTLMWLKSKQDSFKLPNGFENVSNETWIKFNVNSSSYARINYHPETYWTTLAEVLSKNPKMMSTSDRANLIDDTFSLAKAGLISYRVPLELVRYIGQEEDYVPWKTFDVHAQYIREMMQYSENYGGWKSYIEELTRPALRRINYNQNGTHIERMIRSVVLSMSCGVGARDCLSNVTKLLKASLNDGEYILPSLRGVVYRHGMQASGHQQEWEKLWNNYVNCTVPQEKTRLLLGLAQAREAWLINRLLVYAMNDQKIRSQDSFTVFTYLATNPLGRALVWDWARINWPVLVNKFKLSNRYLGRMIPGIVHHFNTPFKLKEVESFFAQYPDAGAGERARRLALDTIRANIDWMERNVNEIADWLKSKGYQA